MIDMNKIGNYIKEERKKAGLTQEEFEIMKTHTTKGYDIILRIFNDEGEEEYMQ